MGWHEIFNSKFIDSISSSYDVIDIDPSPHQTIKQVRLLFDKIFFNINHNKLNMDPYFDTTHVSCSKTLRSICDGIVLVEDNAKWYLILCEMKSTLSSHNYFAAKAQIEISFFKASLFINGIKEFKNKQIQPIMVFITAEDLSDISKARYLAMKAEVETKCPEYTTIKAKKEVIVKHPIDKICDFSAALIGDTPALLFEVENDHEIRIDEIISKAENLLS